MFKRKRYIRLDQIPGTPKSSELKRLLFESDRAHGCTVELPWRSQTTGLRYSITVCHESSGSEPVWSLYQGEGAQSRMIWTQAFKDPELLSDVINLSLPAEAPNDNFSESARSTERDQSWNPNQDRSKHTYSSTSRDVELLSLPLDATLPPKPDSDPFFALTPIQGSEFPTAQSKPTEEKAIDASEVSDGLIEDPVVEEPVQSNIREEAPVADSQIAAPAGDDSLLSGNNQQIQQQPQAYQYPPNNQQYGAAQPYPQPYPYDPNAYPAGNPQGYAQGYPQGYPPQDPNAYAQGHAPPGYPPQYPQGFQGAYAPGYAPQYPPPDPALYPQAYPPPGYPMPYPPGYPLPPGYAPPPGYPVQQYATAPGGVTIPRVFADSDLIAKRPNVLLGDFLVETGLIPAPTLDAALQLQEMVRNGSLSTTKAAEAVRRAHNRGGEMEQFSPSAPPTEPSGTKVNAPPLGEILVEAGLIRINILKAALNLQEVVRTGALSKEEAVEAFIQEHFGKAGKQGTGESSHDQNVLDLFIKAKLIQPGDLDAAIAVKKRHGGEVSKILEAAGKVDKQTFEAAGKCQTLLEEKRLKIEQAIIALHYCQRSRVSFDDAIEELGWEKP